MRREFDTPPYSTKIALGDQAQLRCHPPKGNPPARVVYWLKNGVKIEDKNFIQSTDGHLLILQARMSDNANYSCVAANSENLKRTSPPAVLTVYGKSNMIRFQGTARFRSDPHDRRKSCPP